MYSLPEARRAMREVGLVEGLPRRQLCINLEIAARLGDTGQGMLAFYLSEMQRRSAQKLTGHDTTVQYAVQRLDLSKRRARELVRTGNKLRDLPLVWQAFCDQRIGWSKVLQLVKVVVPETQASWLRVAESSTVSRLKGRVAEVKEGDAPRKPGDVRGLPQPRSRLSLAVDALTETLLERAMEKLSAEMEETLTQERFLRLASEMVLATDDDGKTPGRNPVDASLYVVHLDSHGEDGPLLVDTERGPMPFDGDGPVEANVSRAIGEDATWIDRGGKVLDRTTPAAMRRACLRRDRHRCRACGRRHELHAHHIAWREHGGPTALWNLLTVCRRCHGLLHAGLLFIVGKRAEEAVFVDGDQRPLEKRGGYVHAEALLRLETSVRDGPLAPADEAVPREKVPPQEAFAGVFGQDAVVKRLARAAEGSARRRRAFPHTLLTGPPGTGKTTLAAGVAATTGGRLVRRIGRAVGDVAAMAEVLSELRPGDVLFLDEVHAVPGSALEFLYDAMQEETPGFTLLAATTHEGKLDEAFVSRFGLRVALGFQPPEALVPVIESKAAEEGLAIAPTVARTLAERARGTPREALRLLDRVLDDVAASSSDAVDEATVLATLAREGYDAVGLAPDEQRYMALLRSGTCLSLGQLARRLGKDAETVRERIEPHLLRRAWIRITDRGRVATPRALGALRLQGGERSPPPNSSEFAREPRPIGRVGASPTSGGSRSA